VRIVSKDPFTAPEIQPNYLVAEADCAAFLRGLHFVRRLFAAQPLAGYVEIETWPGSALPLTPTSPHSCVARGPLSSIQSAPVEWATSAPSGPAIARARSCRLKGHRRLSHATMVSGNTYAATMMVAERGAELVLAGT
jgi:choline dehydrogenase